MFKLKMCLSSSSKIYAALRKGFTLIELLIVVAIIAILAGIAVPNFLEAQVRYKVTRSLAEMRTIATASEIYRIGHRGALPGNPAKNMFNWIARYEYWSALTTPTAYMS